MYFFPNLTDLTFKSELNLHNIHNICRAYPNLQCLKVQNLTEDSVQAITTKRSDLWTLPLPNLKTLIVEYICGAYLLPADLVCFQETLLDSSNQITLISSEKYELQQPLNFLIELTLSK